MAEWLNAAVSKTVIPGNWDRGFESPPLRTYKIMIKKLNLTFVIFLFTTLLIYAQKSNENWVGVDIENQSALYINVTGLSNFTGDDIYVWTLEETKEPMSLDGVEGDIYKTKTYYLINKKLQRYSIMQVMYFDENDNILKSYSYEHNSDNPDFKYSTPILKDSEMEKIFIKCLEFIPSVNSIENQ